MRYSIAFLQENYLMGRDSLRKFLAYLSFPYFNKYIFVEIIISDFTLRKLKIIFFILILPFTFHFTTFFLSLTSLVHIRGVQVNFQFNADFFNLVDGNIKQTIKKLKWNGCENISTKFRFVQRNAFKHI